MATDGTQWWPMVADVTKFTWVTEFIQSPWLSSVTIALNLVHFQFDFCLFFSNVFVQFW